MAPPASARSIPDHRTAAYTLVVIALAVAVLGIGLAYAIDAASRLLVAPHRFDSETTLERTIGGRSLKIPLAWFRQAEGEVENFSSRVQLEFRLPLGADGAMRGIVVDLVPRSGVRASAHLLDSVYLHLFQSGEVSGGPTGLIGKPLRPAEGYSSEVVWYDPISAEPFVAKCAAATERARAADCLRTVYLAPALAAIYRFPADALAGWRSMDELLLAQLRRIGAVGN